MEVVDDGEEVDPMWMTRRRRRVDRMDDEDRVDVDCMTVDEGSVIP